LYEFLGFCGGAFEVSVLLGCGATSQWVISDRHFETVVVSSPRVEMSVVSRCSMWIAITVTVRLLCTVNFRIE
jgi:hypothetical protein